MRTGPLLFFGSALVLLAVQLFLPPVVGVANNGDFSKAYGIFNLTMPVQEEARFAATTFTFDSHMYYWARYYSSELLLVPPALALNAVVSKDGAFDLRCMGLIHAALFMLALWLFAPVVEALSTRLRVMVCALVLVIYGDVMYVSYLNSFYMDVATYLFLLLAVVCYLRVLRWHRPKDLALFALFSVLLVTSKAQHATLGLWIALLAWLTRRSLLGERFRFRGMLAAVLLSALSVGWAGWSTPPDYAAKGCFTVVFYRILPGARNVDQTLADLGLDASWKSFIGMHCYSDGARMEDPAFVRVVRQKLSYGVLAQFFLTHPRDVYVALRKSLDEAGRQRPALGNFDASAGRPAFAESRAFALWSDAKHALFWQRGSRFLNCYVALAAATLILIWMQRENLPAGALAAGIALVGMASTELGIASLADAADIPRHHFIFYALADLLVLTLFFLVAGLGARCTGQWTRRLRRTVWP